MWNFEAGDSSKKFFKTWLDFLNFSYLFYFAETGLNDAASVNHPLTAGALTPRDRDRDREILSMQLVMQQLKMDNDNLRKQLVNAKENADCYR